MTYPDTLVRGISDKNTVDPDDSKPAVGAMNFKEVGRSDSYKELSINWVDDEGAISEIRNRRKENGEIQFKAGLALVNRKKIEVHLADSIMSKEFCYERKPDPENKYHGNLLMNAKKKIERMIVAVLCYNCVDEIQPPLEE